MENKIPAPAKIPTSVGDWIKFVGRENEISQDVRTGKQLMHIAQTQYHSGSKIRQSEFLHLRSFWIINNGLDVLDSFFSDNGAYRGYVSPENHVKAAAIHSQLSQYWKKYEEKLSDPSAELTTDIDCGGWDTVRHFQDMTRRHVKREVSPKWSNVLKVGYSPPGLSSATVDAGGEKKDTSDSGVTSWENTTISDPNRKTMALGAFPTTPIPEVYNMALHSELNKSSRNEVYPNTGLVLLLEEARKEMAEYIPRINWSMDRLTLCLLTMPDLVTAKGKGTVLPSLRVELMKAQVDGYFCRRSENDTFSPEPLAICETKPFLRTKSGKNILRQETAEMACWIAQHHKSPEGLLRPSASGRKRRLLIAQDRHEIYIIIGEYGQRYQEYITGHLSLAGGAAPAPSDFDAEANKKAAMGSASYNARAEASGADLLRSPQPMAKAPTAARPRSRKPVTPGGASSAAAPEPQGHSMRTRSQMERELPPADEFLVMHQYGPFLTADASHMSHFVRRLIAFMLELDQNSQ